jgi:hypothetical protein
MGNQNIINEEKGNAVLPLVSSRYDDNDVVLTTDDELFFFWEVKKYGLTIKEKATKKEAIEYKNEFAYWQKEESENISAANYGSSYGC